MTNQPSPTSIKAVADMLRMPDETLKQFTDGWKRLTDQDKADLKQGIADGTLTY